MTQFNNDVVIIDTVKLRDYCLSPSHPRGKHKARVFLSALSLEQKDWQLLASAIREGLQEAIWINDRSDEYGTRYHVDVNIEFLERSAKVRTLWIVRNGEEIPRLTSCFVYP